jgi:hypothetical protein
VESTLIFVRRERERERKRERERERDYSKYSRAYKMTNTKATVSIFLSLIDFLLS